MKPLLSVRDLRVFLDTASGPLSIVDGVSFDIAAGQVFGLAGESGSGKTITALALLGLLPAGARTGGSAILDGRDLLTMGNRQRRRTRGREVAMVFQDPVSSLHPMLTIERQLTEHLRYQLGMSPKEAVERAVQLLTDVRIPNPKAALRGYPHQFSGGMRQRIQIAIGLACEPRLLIADEPTTALDVTVQAGILRLLHRLCQEKDLAVMLITHDLGVLSALADTVTVIRKHPNVYADISAIFYRQWSMYNALRLATEWSVMHKLLLGSDYPIASPQETIEGTRRVNDILEGTKLPRVPEDQIEAIIHRDSLSLLGLNY